MRIAVALVAVLCARSVGLPAATTQPKKKSAHHKVASHKPVTHVAQKAKKAPVSSAWHPGQSAPAPGRYKEIQEALAKKGYLHGEPSGVWNQDSTDALRHFQQDQNLQASGKLDSLSIIALGLGPKH